jgi:hypothetical protein
MGGTTRWQAPELLDYVSDDVENLGQNTTASDLYSFACVCYEVQQHPVFQHPAESDDFIT